jgi:hypothetical protein
MVKDTVYVVKRLLGGEMTPRDILETYFTKEQMRDYNGLKEYR